MSVAKNVASNTSTTPTAGTAAAKTMSAAAEPPVAAKAAGASNGSLKGSNGGIPKPHNGDIPQSGESNELPEEAPREAAPPEQSKMAAKSDIPGPTRKSSFLFNVGGGNSKQSPERHSVTDKRSLGVGGAGSKASSPANTAGGGPGAAGGERARKKSSEFWKRLILPFAGRRFYCSDTMHSGGREIEKGKRETCTNQPSCARYLGSLNAVGVCVAYHVVKQQ